MSQSDQNIMDGLAQAARVKGRYARMLPEKPTKEEMKSAAAFVRDWCDRSKLSLGQLANKSGMSRSVVSQVINLNYAGDIESKMRELLAFIDNYEIAKDVIRPDGLVETRGVKLMWSVIQQTMATRTIGVISAPAGFSKSVVLKAAHEKTRPGSLLIEIDEKHKTPTGVIRLIADQLSIAVAGSSARLLELIRRKLNDSHRLILVDQAHEMRRDALNVLRTINDMECPIVLAGTKTVHSVIDDIAEGSQIYSRIGMVLSLEEEIGLNDGGGAAEPIFTVDQVLKICAAGELRFAADAHEFLHRLAHAPGLGALRTCKLLIRVVAQIPGVRERPITASMLTRAFRQLKGAGYHGFAARSMDKVKVEQKATA